MVERLCSLPVRGRQHRIQGMSLPPLLSCSIAVRGPTCTIPLPPRPALPRRWVFSLRGRQLRHVWICSALILPEIPHHILASGAFDPSYVRLRLVSTSCVYVLCSRLASMITDGSTRLPVPSFEFRLLVPHVGRVLAVPRRMTGHLGFWSKRKPENARLYWVSRGFHWKGWA